MASEYDVTFTPPGRPEMTREEALKYLEMQEFEKEMYYELGETHPNYPDWSREGVDQGPRPTKAQAAPAPTPAPAVNPDDVLTRDEALEWMKSYMDRDVFSNKQFTPEEIAEPFLDWAAQEPQRAAVLPDLLKLGVAQLQAEGALSGKGRSSRENPFNVGEFDEGTMMEFDNPKEGVEAYANLMAKDYLNLSGEKPIKPLDLIKASGAFVNYRGDRYASNDDYEQMLSQIINFMDRKYPMPTGTYQGGE